MDSMPCLMGEELTWKGACDMQAPWTSLLPFGRRRVNKYIHSIFQGSEGLLSDPKRLLRPGICPACPVLIRAHGSKCSFSSMLLAQGRLTAALRHVSGPNYGSVAVKEPTPHMVFVGQMQNAPSVCLSSVSNRMYH